MKLGKGEYTTRGFIDYLKSTYGGKINGNKFTPNDIAQYLRKGTTPYRYGHLKVSSSVVEGIRIIKVG